MTVFCLDIGPSHLPYAIAAYAIPASKGVVLVDCGPASSLERLQQALETKGLSLQQVTHVLITHIHLDHAGAAGHLARMGARLYVHPYGAPHLINPEKLLTSAHRLYGDQMESLWGQMFAVPAENLIEVTDQADLILDGLNFHALHTPGHANHHVVYLWEDICFAGDFGGVRQPGPLYLRLPFVPPETHLRKWKESVQRVRTYGAKHLAVSHFGLHSEAEAHWELCLRLLEETGRWLEEIMQDDLDPSLLAERYTAWLWQQGRALGIEEDVLRSYDHSCPAWMSVMGLQRYWKKVVLET